MGSASSLRCLWAVAGAPLLAVGGLGSAPGEGIVLLVRGQDTPHDASLLEALTASVAEAGWAQRSVVSLASLARELGHDGLWSYKPWIFHLQRELQRSRSRVAGGQRWFVFLEPTTAVDPAALAALLGAYDAREDVYLGRALRDETSSILHSYSEEPPYPLVHAGFALSGGLVQRLARDLATRPLGEGLHHPQQIEPVFELAQWLRVLGVSITARGDAFCAMRRSGCATWVSRRRPHRRSRGLAPQDVVIAVKTVEKFHASRIPHVHEFWGSTSAAEVLYLSNANFSGVPGADVVDLSPEFGSLVDPARESTKQGSGHCSKMEAILRYLARHRAGRRWYVVTDDDTLLNVPGLLEVLDSHDDAEAVYLGERYGWGHREESEGTNYITTGGGMALSARALELLGACGACTCHRPSAPDDMTLGAWFAELRVRAVHEEGFHQAEPHNYHPEVLASGDPPVSFHRFAVRLPQSTPEAEKAAARRANWRAWAGEYFRPEPRGEL